MKNKTTDWIIGINWAAIIIFLALHYNYAIGCESCKMYEVLWNKSSISHGIGGYSYKDEFYCVWTKGVKNESVYNNEIHEKCHILIASGRHNHFCENG